MSVFLAAEELLIAILEFDKSLQEVSLNLELPRERRRLKPIPRGLWKSKINYQPTVSGVLAQIVMRSYANYTTPQLEEEMKELQKLLPNRESLQNAIGNESLNKTFNDNLEKYRRALFTYHYRDNKDIRREEIFEKTYLAATTVYSDFLTRQLQPDVSAVIEKMRSSLRAIEEKIKKVLEMPDMESALRYLVIYMEDLQSLKLELQNQQKKFGTKVEKDFNFLSDKIFALELKIKNEQDRLQQLLKDKEPERSFASQMAARREVIAGDDEEDDNEEDTSWLD